VRFGRAGAGIALMVLLGAAALTSGCEKVSDAAFEGKVRRYLLRHPEVIEEAVNQLNSNRAKAETEKARAAISRHRNAIERDPRDFVMNPTGKITVTEFYDYNCTYCKAAAPQVLALIRENPDVRFVFKEFPIFGGDSDKASALALAARDQGKSLTLYREFFSAPTHLDQPGMERILAAAGLNVAQMEERAGSPAIKTHLEDTRALAEAIGVVGTPNFVVGDGLYPGASLDALRRAIMEARQKKS